MWYGALVEVRGYYKGVCPSAMEVLLYPLSHLASPVFTFQGRVLAMLLKLG